jgi:hypothetical protein
MGDGWSCRASPHPYGLKLPSAARFIDVPALATGRPALWLQGRRSLQPIGQARQHRHLLGQGAGLRLFLRQHAAHQLQRLFQLGRRHAHRNLNHQRFLNGAHAAVGDAQHRAPAADSSTGEKRV